MDETLPYNPNMFLGTPAMTLGGPSMGGGFFGSSPWATGNSYGGLDLGNLNVANWGLGTGGNQSLLGKVGSWFSNGNNLGTAADMLQGIAGAYLGYQNMKQAKANLAFQKQVFDTNLTNSIASYNTSLEDKIRGRTSDYQGKEADVQAYLAKHSLTKK